MSGRAPWEVQSLVVGMDSYALTGVILGCQGPRTRFLFAAGGSLFLAFPTTWTFLVITLLPGGAATPTGLSKDQKLA